MTSPNDNAPEVESSSPACSMHQADDGYMGYAGKEELTAILTELLEAERAGVRVTHESALTARGGPLGELMRAIEKDEARWCAMLAGHLRMLGWPLWESGRGPGMKDVELDAQVRYAVQSEGLSR